MDVKIQQLSPLQLLLLSYNEYIRWYSDAFFSIFWAFSFAIWHSIWYPLIHAISLNLSFADVHVSSFFHFHHHCISLSRGVTPVLLNDSFGYARNQLVMPSNPRYQMRFWMPFELTEVHTHRYCIITSLDNRPWHKLNYSGESVDVETIGVCLIGDGWRSTNTIHWSVQIINMFTIIQSWFMLMC